MRLKTALLLAGIIIIVLTVLQYHVHFHITLPDLKRLSFQTSVLPRVNSSLWATNNLIHCYSTDRKWTDTDISSTPASIVYQTDDPPQLTVSDTSSHFPHPTATDDVPSQFSLSDIFHFPHPRASEVASIMRKHSWIQELRSILKDWKPKRQVIMVASNSAYQEVLLNWLISAALVIPLNQVLVIALDEPVWRLMHNKGFQSVFVPPSSLAQNSRAITPFGQIMLTRLSVLRLLNHWGFDVAMIDTDALLLKDLWLLFDKYPDSGIVASQGKFPGELSTKWGTALCVGVILIRSSNQTEDFWKAVAEIQPKSFSDQGRINHGLEALQAKWQRLDDGTFEGECANGLRVNTLSYSHVCRSNCNKNKMSSYSVWHRPASRDGKSKIKAAVQGSIWLLSPQWNSTCESSYLRQHMWLKCIHA